MANYVAGQKITNTELLDWDDVIMAKFRDSGTEIVGQYRNLCMSLNWATISNMIDFYEVTVGSSPRVDMFREYPNIEQE